jgi:hypothetical protein
VTDLLIAVSLATAAAGVLLGGAVWLATHRLRTALPVTLELLTAAGLLRLSSDNTWRAIGTAAAVIAIRKLVQISLLHARPAPRRGRPFTR